MPVASDDRKSALGVTLIIPVPQRPSPAGTAEISGDTLAQDSANAHAAQHDLYWAQCASPMSPHTGASLRYTAERAMTARPGVCVNERPAMPGAECNGVVLVEGPANAHGTQHACAVRKTRDDVYSALRLGHVAPQSCGPASGGHDAIVLAAIGEDAGGAPCNGASRTLHIRADRAAVALGRRGDFALRALLVHGVVVSEEGRVQVANIAAPAVVAVTLSGETAAAVDAVAAELETAAVPGACDAVASSRRALDWLLAFRSDAVRELAATLGVALVMCSSASKQCCVAPKECAPGADTPGHEAHMEVHAATADEAACAAAAIDEMLFDFHAAALCVPARTDAYAGAFDAYAAAVDAAETAVQFFGVEAAVRRDSMRDAYGNAAPHAGTPQTGQASGALVVEVFGEADAVAAALQHVASSRELASTSAGLQMHARYRLRASERIRDFVSGKKDGKLIKIMKETGVSLALQPAAAACSHGAAPRAYLDIELVGADARAVAAALDMLRGEFPAEISFFLAEGHHKRLIGHGGRTIQRVMKTFAVYVKFLSGTELLDAASPASPVASPALQLQHGSNIHRSCPWSVSENNRGIQAPVTRLNNVIVRTPAKNAGALAAARDAILNMAEEDERVLHDRTLLVDARAASSPEHAALRLSLATSMQRASENVVFALRPAEGHEDCVSIVVNGPAAAVSRFLESARSLAPLVLGDSETDASFSTHASSSGPLTVGAILRGLECPPPFGMISAPDSPFTSSFASPLDSPMHSPMRNADNPWASPMLANATLDCTNEPLSLSSAPVSPRPSLVFGAVRQPVFGSLGDSAPSSGWATPDPAQMHIIPPPCTGTARAESWSAQSPTLFSSFASSVLHVQPASPSVLASSPLLGIFDSNSGLQLGSPMHSPGGMPMSPLRNCWSHSTPPAPVLRAASAIDFSLHTSTPGSPLVERVLHAVPSYARRTSIPASDAMDSVATAVSAAESVFGDVKAFDPAIGRANAAWRKPDLQSEYVAKTGGSALLGIGTEPGAPEDDVFESERKRRASPGALRF